MSSILDYWVFFAEMLALEFYNQEVEQWGPDLPKLHLAHIEAVIVETVVIVEK